jgi:hypothetical protein
LKGLLHPDRSPKQTVLERCHGMLELFENGDYCPITASSVSIALGYGLDDWGSRVQFPVGAGNFPLHHLIQNDSGAHPASYPVGTRGSFPGGKAAGA